MYREIKLRGAIIVPGGQLKLLQLEQIFKRLDNVLNLSSDQGNMGTFIISNVRVVWFADMNETFNISLPFVQIATIRIRESKYGPALVLQTCETGGSYILGISISYVPIDIIL
jgi:Bardet-Biedl syndrome 5 protein